MPTTPSDDCHVSEAGNRTPPPNLQPPDGAFPCNVHEDDISAMETQSAFPVAIDE